MARQIYPRLQPRVQFRFTKIPAATNLISGKAAPPRIALKSLHMNVAEELRRTETVYQGLKGVCRALRGCTSTQARRVARGLVFLLHCGRVGRWGIWDATNASINLIGTSR